MSLEQIKNDIIQLKGGSEESKDKSTVADELVGLLDRILAGDTSAVNDYKAKLSLLENDSMLKSVAERAVEG